jgi:OPA family glycerol-3-phosphate transporter-like MFS transporter/OPA family sugar phosphate sensor protein UhpC-like MFS transporter
MLRIFAPAPALPLESTDPAEIAAKYRHWQKRVLLSSIIGYATFYFVRKNLSIAMPVMQSSLGFKKTQLGLFLTLHGLLYGVSKFANGFLGDRANARAFMAFGLGASALMNVFFGFNSAVVTLGLIWMANGWFQGMGFPPCARLLTHWFPPDRLATKWSIWNTSHCLGAGLVVILCSQLVATNWRLCFFVPAAIAFVCAVYLWLALPDTPPSVGLPEVEGTHVAGSPGGSTKEFLTCLVENVFRNKYVWIVSIANFFVML